METTTPPISPTPEKKPFFSTILGNVVYFCIAIVIALGVQHYIFRPFIVSGSSMDPTFKTGEYLIIDELSYHFHPPRRGDVVVFKAPPEPKKYYIKRVIGLPGETIKLEGTKVTIVSAAHPEGITLSEGFITHPQIGSLTFIVPPNQYFVMGDNRAGSYDSRKWGAVPAENIRGRAYLRLIPLQHISFLPGKEATYDNTN